MTKILPLVQSGSQDTRSIKLPKCTHFNYFQISFKMKFKIAFKNRASEEATKKIYIALKFRLHYCTIGRRRPGRFVRPGLITSPILVPDRFGKPGEAIRAEQGKHGDCRDCQG